MSGPESRRTAEIIPLSPPAALPPVASPPSTWPLPEDPPAADPDELPRTPLLSDPNFCVIAEIFGVMTPEMRSWKLWMGAGDSMLCCLFFSIFDLSNWSMNLVLASMNWSSFYNRTLTWILLLTKRLTKLRTKHRTHGCVNQLGFCYFNYRLAEMKRYTWQWNLRQRRILKPRFSTETWRQSACASRGRPPSCSSPKETNESN